MVDDALKQVRLIHRLIIAVSAIVLVFASSLNISDGFPFDNQIGKLVNKNFLEYDSFVSKRINSEIAKINENLNDDIQRKLSLESFSIFGVDELYSVLTSSIHTGKIQTKDLVLANPRESTLNQLDALNGLSIERDAQVVIPIVSDELIVSLREFLEEHGSAGSRLSSLNIVIDSSELIAESFLPGKTSFAYLYFEIIEPRVGASPVFNSLFEAKIQSVQDTSFVYWIQSQEDLYPDVVSVDNGSVKFADDVPKVYRDERLANLSHDVLKSSEETTQLEEMPVKLLAIDVPGRLFVFAAPVLLLGLGLYFLFHTGHLITVASEEPKTVRLFGWAPLFADMRNILRNRMAEDILSTILLAFTVVLLPVGSLIFLHVQLCQLEILTVWQTTILISSETGISIISIFSLRNIHLTRRMIFQ